MKFVETASDYARKINDIKIHFSHFGSNTDDCLLLAIFTVEYDGSIFQNCSVSLTVMSDYYNVDFHYLAFKDAKWKDGKRRNPDFMQVLYEVVAKKIEVLIPIWHEDYRNTRMVNFIKSSSKKARVSLLDWNLVQQALKEDSIDPEKLYQNFRLVRRIVWKAN